MSFNLDKTSDGGFVLGPDLPKRDIHLTVFEKDGKIRSHIHHAGVEEPNDSPLGRVVSTRVVSSDFNRMLKKRLKRYHGNKTCYIFTEERWRKIKMFLPKVDGCGNLLIPIESFLVFLDMRFSRKDRWKKVKIRSLLNLEPGFAFMGTRAGLRMIMPITEKSMFAWPALKANELGDYVMKVSGVDDFFDYLESAGASKEMRTDMLKKIQNQHTDRKQEMN